MQVCCKNCCWKDIEPIGVPRIRKPVVISAGRKVLVPSGSFFASTEEVVRILVFSRLRMALRGWPRRTNSSRKKRASCKGTAAVVSST